MPAGLPDCPGCHRWRLPGLNLVCGLPDWPGLNLNHLPLDSVSVGWRYGRWEKFEKHSNRLVGSDQCPSNKSKKVSCVGHCARPLARMAQGKHFVSFVPHLDWLI